MTASLYVPRGAGPFPVVLGPCGHSQDGKACGKYQAFASGLARRGYMVLVYDPISQGERVQLTRRIGRFTPGSCVNEHNMLGNRLAMLGEFFGTWRLWDGIRGLDYLLGRPKADRGRVGLTGNSGGGTMTTYLSALDDRFTMAAPSCFVTTFLCNMENELPADSEQTPPRMLAEGLDAADYFIAQIPRPVLLLGQADDYFDLRGLRRTHEELKHLYALVGAGDRVELFIGSHGHGFFEENRKAMYRFFARFSGQPGDVKPSENPPEPEEALYATPEGSVLKAGSRNALAILKEKAVAVEVARARLDDAELCRRVKKVLNLPARRGAPHYRILRHRPPGTAKYSGHSVYAVETEPMIRAVLHYYGPAAPFHLPRSRKATLYVPHVSSEEDVTAGLVSKAAELFAVDVRGIGLTRARTCGDTDFFHPYGSDYFYAVHGQMLGEPYLGRRVHDLLRVLDLLAANGCEGVNLEGRGLGALTATFAACLHPVVRCVVLRNAPASYGEMMEHPVVEWPRSAMVAGLLEQFDLPDCYALLRRARKLRILSSWNHLMRPPRKP